MKKKLEVSKIASTIYQTAKISSSFGGYKEEWPRAMKKAWAIIHDTAKTREKRKIAWEEQEAKRKDLAKKRSDMLKVNMENIRKNIAKDNRPMEKKISEGAFNESKRFKKMGIVSRIL